jgi:hypothetical protein
VRVFDAVLQRCALAIGHHSGETPHCVIFVSVLGGHNSAMFMQADVRPALI